MNDGQLIDAAAKRLSQALDGLEAAVERRTDADRAQAGLVAQVQALGDDRARLANDLDAISARTKRLEAANRDAMRRIDETMQTIRTVVERGES